MSCDNSFNNLSSENFKLAFFVFTAFFLVMFFLFKNDVLRWPEQEGRISLKLENINHLNQFISGRSHHAMVDVEVTIELAKIFLREREMNQPMS